MQILPLKCLLHETSCVLENHCLRSSKKSYNSRRSPDPNYFTCLSVLAVEQIRQGDFGMTSLRNGKPLFDIALLNQHLLPTAPSSPFRRR